LWEKKTEIEHFLREKPVSRKKAVTDVLNGMGHKIRKNRKGGFDSISHH